MGKEIKNVIFLCICVAFLFTILGAFIIPNYVTTTNYAQAPHTNVDYYISGNTLTINNVIIGAGKGSSMQPIMFTGNKAIIKENFIFEELKEGQIIRYNLANSNIIHRIKAIYSKDKILVEGDNTQQSEFINFSNINGIVVGVIYE